MFLIVFVTLMISIIGLYAQVLGLQANKLYNSQVALMQTMVSWHGAATNLARANAATIALQSPNTGCSMTSGAGTTACTGFTLTAGSPYLPPGYSATSFPFYSIAYQNGGTPYVVTFVHDTNSTGFSDPTKDLMLPVHGGTEIGYSLNGLMRQFARAAPTNLTYGSVSTVGPQQVVTVPTITEHSDGTVTNGTISYTVPSTIPSGSLAIISAAQ